MKFFKLFALLFIFSTSLISAELKFEAYGYGKSEIYNLSEENIFVHYTNKYIFTTDVGIRGEGTCKGIVEVLIGQTTSNVVCKGKEQNGDIHFAQFKATPDSAFTTEGKQVFTFVTGEGRWKELIGSKCIGATSQITFNAESGTFEDTYMWVGKCNIPDASYEIFIITRNLNNFIFLIL